MPARAPHLLGRLLVPALAGGLPFAACTFPEYDFPPAVARAGSGGSDGGAPAAPAGGASGAGEGGVAGALPAAGAGGGVTSGGAGGGGANSVGPHCLALLEADPSLGSGAQRIDPDGDGPGQAFEAYCDMELDGGGWTLLGNFLNTSFDATTSGSTSQPCYDTVCANRAYSTLPLQSDLRIDAAGAAIAGEGVDSTAIFRGIDESAAGRTLRSIFTGGEPAFVEAPTSTSSTEWFNGVACYTWSEYGAAVCDPATILLFEDPSACDTTIFAVGISQSYDNLESNCAGWPQDIGSGTPPNFPPALRIWTR